MDGFTEGEAEAFVGAVEECAVVAVVEMRNPDRAAAGDAEIVANFLRLFGFAVGSGVERAILVIPEEAAVIIVGAALGDGSNCAGLAEFGVVADAVHAKLGDRFG